MKKANAPKICCTISIILLILFAVKTIFDYTQYQKTFTSAPFYVWILVNALIFIVPAIIAFIIGLIIKRKSKN